MRSNVWSIVATIALLPTSIAAQPVTTPREEQKQNDLPCNALCRAWLGSYYVPPAEPAEPQQTEPTVAVVAPQTSRPSGTKLSSDSALPANPASRVRNRAMPHGPERSVARAQSPDKPPRIQAQRSVGNAGGTPKPAQPLSVAPVYGAVAAIAAPPAIKGSELDPAERVPANVPSSASMVVPRDKDRLVVAIVSLTPTLLPLPIHSSSNPLAEVRPISLEQAACYANVFRTNARRRRELEAEFEVSFSAYWAKATGRLEQEDVDFLRQTLGSFVVDYLPCHDDKRRSTALQGVGE